MRFGQTLLTCALGVALDKVADSTGSDESCVLH
jgi:hypothetical protein